MMNIKDRAKEQAISTYWNSASEFRKRRIIDLEPDHTFYILRRIWNVAAMQKGILSQDDILLHAGYRTLEEMPLELFEGKHYLPSYLINLVPALMYCTLENYNLGKLCPFAAMQFETLIEKLN